MDQTKEKKHSTGSEQSNRLHTTSPRTFSNQCHILNKGAIDWYYFTLKTQIECSSLLIIILTIFYQIFNTFHHII